MPSSLSVRGGASVPLTVYALRRDGFTNEITLALQDAPTGFKLTGAKVPANQDQVRLTLMAPPEPTEEPLRLSLEGRASVQGHAVVHPAVPAEDMMQAFAYRHLVPAKELDVAVSGRFMNRMPLKILSATPVKIPAGGTARVRVGAPSSAFADRFRLELNEPPEGITLGNVSPVSEGAEIELRSDAAKAKPGLKGNLIVNIMQGQALVAAQKNKKQANQTRLARRHPARHPLRGGSATREELAHRLRRNPDLSRVVPYLTRTVAPRHGAGTCGPPALSRRKKA